MACFGSSFCSTADRVIGPNAMSAKNLVRMAAVVSAGATAYGLGVDSHDESRASCLVVAGALTGEARVRGDSACSELMCFKCSLICFGSEITFSLVVTVPVKS